MPASDVYVQGGMTEDMAWLTSGTLDTEVLDTQRINYNGYNYNGGRSHGEADSKADVPGRT